MIFNRYNNLFVVQIRRWTIDYITNDEKKLIIEAIESGRYDEYLDIIFERTEIDLRALEF